VGTDHETGLLHAMVGTRRVGKAASLMSDEPGTHPLQRAFDAGAKAARRPTRARGRAAVWLHHIEGYAPAEVAQIVRCSTAEVERLLCRSRLRRIPVRANGYDSFHLRQG